MPKNLSDIKGKEVSLVDRAANKKKFLLVKSDKEGAMAEEVQFLELESFVGQTIPAEVLSEVIKSAKVVIDRAVALSEKLESFQKSEDDLDGLSANEVVEEFQVVEKVLGSILRNPQPETPNKEDGQVKGDEDVKKDEGTKPDADPKGETEKVAFLEKAFKELTEKVGDLTTSVESLKKSAEANQDKAKEGDDKGKEDVSKKDEAPAFDADKILEDVRKEIDERSKKLVSMFQEAATEEFKEFGQVLKDVAEIKKALGGEGDTQPEGETKPSARTYGHGEEDREITSEENPFFSIFESVKDF